MGLASLAAFWNSRLTWSDWLEAVERISRQTRQSAKASMMASLQSWPGAMSRGATQHRMPCPSRAAQTASEIDLSRVE